MKEDTLIALGWVMWLMLTACFWLFRAFLRYETDRFATAQVELSGKRAIRIGNVTASYVLVRVLWTMATTLAALTFGEFIVAPKIQQWLQPVCPPWFMVTYCILAFAALWSMLVLWWKDIKLNVGVLLLNKDETE